jgi:hypothetical protein
MLIGRRPTPHSANSGRRQRNAEYTQSRDGARLMMALYSTTSKAPNTL